MVEKPLTHSRRKANPNLEKMKPELRQLEEQYAAIIHLCHRRSHSGYRFTVYNYTNMQRMSYYPHNHPVIALGTESNDTERTYTQSGTILPTTTIIERSRAGTPMLESTSCHHPPILHTSKKGYVASWIWILWINFVCVICDSHLLRQSDRCCSYLYINIIAYIHSTLVSYHGHRGLHQTLLYFVSALLVRNMSIHLYPHPLRRRLSYTSFVVDVQLYTQVESWVMQYTIRLAFVRSDSECDSDLLSIDVLSCA